MMADSPWLAELKASIARNAGGNHAGEQQALGALELLPSVPDDEIRRAYLASDGEAGDPLVEVLIAVIEQRGIDL